jgi:hypothetical protein
MNNKILSKFGFVQLFFASLVNKKINCLKYSDKSDFYINIIRTILLCDTKTVADVPIEVFTFNINVWEIEAPELSKVLDDLQDYDIINMKYDKCNLQILINIQNEKASTMVKMYKELGIDIEDMINIFISNYNNI